MPTPFYQTRRKLNDLALGHNRQTLDAALLDSLAGGGLSQEALIEAMLRGLDREIDFADIELRLTDLANTGKPLPPKPVSEGGKKLFGSRLGIQGNPIGLDEAYQGGWHFKQFNGWDAWFTIIPRSSGGYFIEHPAMRLTGQHGPAHIGNSAFGDFDINMNLVFDVNWGGHVGRYVCSIDKYSRRIEGKTFDVANERAQVDFVGTPMPETAERPNKPDTVGRLRFINIEADQTDFGSQYNVVVTGSGFVPREVVTIEGRAYTVSRNKPWDWSIYGTAEVDSFSRFKSDTFGIWKSADIKYSFRALSLLSGYTSEVGLW